MSTTQKNETKEQIEQDAIHSKFKKLLLLRCYDDNSQIPEDKTYLQIKGETIGTAGNFVCFTGLPKVGKSSVIAAMVASAFIKESILGLKILLHPGKNRVAYFDTEQSPFDFKRQMTRIKKYTGNKGAFPSLDCFLVREDTSFEIIQLIETYLKTEPKCGVLIIDGLLDLLENMNDEKEAKAVIRLFKKWGKVYDILIVTVLHLGKKDLTSIGHIGSATDRYTQSTLVIEKEKDQSLTIKPKYLRSSGGFPDINCVYDNSQQVYILNNTL